MTCLSCYGEKMAVHYSFSISPATVERSAWMTPDWMTVWQTTFHDTIESESLLIGRDFGVITDIETGPNVNLFVVSFDQGAMYEIFRR